MSIQKCPFFFDDKRYSFFTRLLLKKGYQVEMVFWEGREQAIQANSLKTSVRELARDLRLAKSTVYDLLNYFAGKGYIELIRSQRSGLIIRVQESDAYRTLATSKSGQLADSLSARKEREAMEARKKARTHSGHHAGQKPGHPRKELSRLKYATFVPLDGRDPDTFPDASADTISLRLRSLINLGKTRHRFAATLQKAPVSPMPAHMREQFLRRRVDREKDAPGGGESVDMHLSEKAEFRRASELPKAEEGTTDAKSN